MFMYASGSHQLGGTGVALELILFHLVIIFVLPVGSTGSLTITVMLIQPPELSTDAPFSVSSVVADERQMWATGIT